MKTENTRADRILDLLGWILLIGTLAYLILGWSSFPVGSTGGEEKGRSFSLK